MFVCVNEIVSSFMRCSEHELNGEHYVGRGQSCYNSMEKNCHTNILQDAFLSTNFYHLCHAIWVARSQWR